MEKMINTVLSILLGFILALAVFGIRYICVLANETAEETVKPYITAEEWANRPVMTTETVVEHKHIEAEPVEELKDEVTQKYKTYEEIPLSEDLQIYMQELCQEYHVGFAFALAIMESESSFDTEARGDSGKSLGLMQINRPNWEKYDLDASMVYDNVEIGIRILGELIEKYQEFDAVVMAYKGGEGKADEWLAEGFRLGACDSVAEQTMYWQSVLDK